TLEQIIERNKELTSERKVRVVSISLGMFSQWPDHDLWVKAVQHATTEGILVVTSPRAARDVRRISIRFAQSGTGRNNRTLVRGADPGKERGDFFFPSP